MIGCRRLTEEHIQIIEYLKTLLPRWQAMPMKLFHARESAPDGRLASRKL